MPCASDGRAGCLLVLALLCGAVRWQRGTATPKGKGKGKGKTRPRIRRALCGVDLVRLLVAMACPVA